MNEYEYELVVTNKLEGFTHIFDTYYDVSRMADNILKLFTPDTIVINRYRSEAVFNSNGDFLEHETKLDNTEIIKNENRTK